MDTRVVVALLLVAGGGAVAVVGAMPQAHLTPSDVVAASAAGDHVVVKATVSDPGDGDGRFWITDGSATILVFHGAPLPPSFDAGRTIVVHGTVGTDGDAGPALTASRIEVGCPSKYEAG